ncbi:hypothetical protein HMPREF3226_01412, partial [Prevotella corporis]
EAYTHFYRTVPMFSIPVMAEYGLLGYLVALTLLVTYNGKRGFIKGQYAKYGVYAYYPVHLISIFLFT